MAPNRFEQEVQQQISEAAERHRVGQVSAVVGSKITVVTSGGASLTIPRLATWTPLAGDIVLIAITPAGWVAIGKIQP